MKKPYRNEAERLLLIAAELAGCGKFDYAKEFAQMAIAECIIATPPVLLSQFDAVGGVQ